METKWMLEFSGAGYPQWWTGSYWSPNCYQGQQFHSQHEADQFLADNLSNPALGPDIHATEHIFMAPLETTVNLN